MKVSIEEAIKNAEDGGLSFYAYFNPEVDTNGKQKSGHVASFSVGDNIQKGEIANIGSKNGFMPLNLTINKSRPRTYYVLLLNVLLEVVVKSNK